MKSLQAICLNNIGSVYLEKGQYQDALTYFQQSVQLRENSKVPGDIVDAVHNLGFAASGMGQYDQAITYYLRALDLRRSMDDPRGAAIESYSLGVLFGYQGRFGAALTSKQDALKTFRDIKDKTFWMAKVLAGVGEALTQAGRGDEAKSYIDEALSLSRELKNDGMVAETLGVQGDMFFYAGDFKSAHASYEQALQAANAQQGTRHHPDRQSQAGQGRSPGKALAGSHFCAQAADPAGRRCRAKIHFGRVLRRSGEAMMQSRDNTHARDQLEHALLLSDKLGMQPLSVRIHYLLATIAQDSGNSNDARDNYREALRLLDAMKKDPGAEKLLQRGDFKAIYDASTAGAQAGKG